MEQLSLFPDMVKPKVGIIGMNDFGIDLMTKFKDAGYEVLGLGDDTTILERIAKECDFVFLNVSSQTTLDVLCSFMDDIYDIQVENKLPNKIFLVKAPVFVGVYKMLSIVYEPNTILLYDDEFSKTGTLATSDVDSFAIVQKHLNKALNIDTNYVDYTKFETAE